MSNPEHDMLRLLSEHVIEKADWPDTPLTDAEKQLIRVAVNMAYYKMAETQVFSITRIMQSLRS